MRKKILCVAAVLLMVSAGIVLSGCGGGADSVTDIQQNVTVGKRVYVDPSNIVFFGYGNLLCTAKLEGSELTEFVVEAGMTGDIYQLAVKDGELFVSASDGFFKYPLDMFESGQKNASATTLMKDGLSPFNHFEIFEDKIFFTYGYDLYYITTEGGEKTKVAEGVTDFEVSDRGIYYAEDDGDLHLMSPDLSEEKEIGEIGADRKFTPGGASLYYRDGSELRAFSLERETSEAVKTEKAVNEYCVPWSNGKNVLYSAEDYSLCLATPKGETDMGKNGFYPGKSEGFLYGDQLLSTSNTYSELQIIDLDKGELKVYELADELADDLGRLDGAGGGASGGGSEPYDIEKGGAKNASSDGSIAYIYFNDFMMIMPNNDKYGYEAKGDQVTFFLFSAQQEGYGGRLVTIKAYDMDDDSYKNLPSYHVAGVGKNVNKRFIAIYPTDVQWNHNDAQQEADYRELDEYLRKIGEGAANSPLKTADSD